MAKLKCDVIHICDNVAKFVIITMSLVVIIIVVVGVISVIRQGRIRNSIKIVKMNRIIQYRRCVIKMRII